MKVHSHILFEGWNREEDGKSGMRETRRDPTRQRNALHTIPSSSPLPLPFFFSPHFCSASPHDRSPNPAPSASSDLAKLRPGGSVAGGVERIDEFHRSRARPDRSRTGTTHGARPTTPESTGTGGHDCARAGVRGGESCGVERAQPATHEYDADPRARARFSTTTHDPRPTRNRAEKVLDRNRDYTHCVERPSKTGPILGPQSRRLYTSMETLSTRLIPVASTPPQWRPAYLRDDTQDSRSLGGPTCLAIIILARRAIPSY
ncbi:hypothetical protein B0H13DRAFT_2318775 [Mycena leptocephala]|nr:hypothetical protein B0H13DRAFT_2318775 [Mycena leptocephala]